MPGWGRGCPRRVGVPKRTCTPICTWNPPRRWWSAPAHCLLRIQSTDSFHSVFNRHCQTTNFFPGHWYDNSKRERDRESEVYSARHDEYEAREGMFHKPSKWMSWTCSSTSAGRCCVKKNLPVRVIAGNFDIRFYLLWSFTINAAKEVVPWS